MFQQARILVACLLVVGQGLRIAVYQKPVSSGQAVLQPSDLTYLGAYKAPLSDGPGQTYYGSSLTHRDVGGHLRFITRQYYNYVVEFSLEGKSYGDTITAITNYWGWGDCYGYGVGDFRPILGLTWIPARNALWTTASNDYAGAGNALLCEHTLDPSDHTWTTTHSGIKLEGVVDKQVNTGFALVPSWFQALYSTAPYFAGFGGYLSTGGQCMGLCAFVIPNIADYADDAEIPDTDFKSAAIHTSTGQATDWYADGHPTTFDRGNRVSRQANYVNQAASVPTPLRELWPSLSDGPRSFAPEQPQQWTGHVDTSGTTVTWVDGGWDWNRARTDNEAPLSTSWWLAANNNGFTKYLTINGVPYEVASIETSTSLTLTASAGTQTNVGYLTPDTRPWEPIAEPASWQSPDPEGNNKWVHGDGLGGNGCAVISGTAKQGLLCLENIQSGTGNCDPAGVGYIGCSWYASAFINSDAQTREFHIYDLNDLGQASNNIIYPAQVQPVYMQEVTLDGVSTNGVSPSDQSVNTIQADYVPETHTFYAFVFGNSDGPSGKLFAWSVNDDASPMPFPIWPVAVIGLALSPIGRKRYGA